MFLKYYYCCYKCNAVNNINNIIDLIAMINHEYEKNDFKWNIILYIMINIINLKSRTIIRKGLNIYYSVLKSV